MGGKVGQVNYYRFSEIGSVIERLVCRGLRRQSYGLLASILVFRC